MAPAGTGSLGKVRGARATGAAFREPASVTTVRAVHSDRARRSMSGRRGDGSRITRVGRSESRCHAVGLMSDDPSEAAGPLTQPVIDQLVENHREFLRFVERRIGNRATAEEIVQDAFVRSLDRAGEIRESVLGWFYQVLRNAVIDRQRRQAVADRRL